MDSNSFVIRPLLNSDIDSAFQIEQTAHIDPWSETQFKRLTQSPYQTVAVFFDGQLLAYAVWFQLNSEEAELFNIAVSPSAQGCGVGRILMNELKQAWDELGLNQVFLEVRESNCTARALYQKMGFEEIAIRPDYYSKETGREAAINYRLIF